LKDCAICLHALGAARSQLCLPCGHCFHEKCIRSWIASHTTCPVCRDEAIHRYRITLVVENLETENIIRKQLGTSAANRLGQQISDAFELETDVMVSEIEFFPSTETELVQMIRDLGIGNFNFIE